MEDWLDGLMVEESDGERMRRALLSAAEGVSQSGAWAWRPDDGRTIWVSEDHSLRPVYRTCADEGQLALTGARLKAGEGLAGMALAQREPVWSHSLGDEPAYPFHDEAVRDQLHGAVALPVIAGDEVLAVIVMSGSEDFENIYDTYEVADRVAKAMREGLLS